MARLYRASMLTTSTTTTQYGTMATVKGDTSRPAFIKELAIFTQDGNTVAGAWGLAWSTAVSGATITSKSFVSNANTSVGATDAVLVVSTSGTIATNGGEGTVFFRFSHPGIGGAGIVLTESELGPIEMALGATNARGELCIVNMNAATPAKYFVNAKIEV
jgi:hypothetical protein